MKIEAQAAEGVEVLRNGNRCGDYRNAARCGAKTRRGTLCQCPAMSNGRCRLHGGLSTGPKTAEGIDRIRLALTRHGRYSVAAKNERRDYRELLGNARQMLKSLRPRYRLLVSLLSAFEAPVRDFMRQAPPSGSSQ